MSLRESGKLIVEVRRSFLRVGTLVNNINLAYEMRTRIVTYGKPAGFAKYYHLIDGLYR
jgi:hypothetical protein